MNARDTIEPLAVVERRAILAAVAIVGANPHRCEGDGLREVARRLRISRTTLWRRLREYAITGHYSPKDKRP